MSKNKLKILMEEKGVTRYRLMKDTGLSWDTVNNLVEAEELPARTNLATLKLLRDTFKLKCIDELEEQQ